MFLHVVQNIMWSSFKVDKLVKIPKSEKQDRRASDHKRQENLHFYILYIQLYIDFEQFRTILF